MNNFRQQAINYKKQIANKFMLVEGQKISKRVFGKDFWVTRKIDGHLQCLFYKNGEIMMLNSQGNEKASQLKCLDQAADSLRKAGVQSAVIAAELYYPRPNGRPRCNDVVSALANEKEREKLCLAPFDIVELNDEDYSNKNYGEKHLQLATIFTAEMVQPVEMVTAHSTEELVEIFEQWVGGEEAEGMVVHSEQNTVYKIKPSHTIDAVVIGYTTGDQGVRSLMMAVRKEDGRYQMFAVGSSGLSDEDRLLLAGRLGKMHTSSQYILSDSRGIAYQMIKPEIVMELSVMELVARANDEKINMNPLLYFDQTSGWLLEEMTPGVSTLGLKIVGERTDKQPDICNIRLSQLTDLCPFEEQKVHNDAPAQSTLMERCVYKKFLGGHIMLHKFVMWKTNKECYGEYPAYILYHTDYSSKRKDAIKRDMIYSNDERQIREIFARELSENIKKGWERAA